MRNILRWIIIVGLIALVLGVLVNAGKLKEIDFDSFFHAFGDTKEDADDTAPDDGGGEIPPAEPEPLPDPTEKYVLFYDTFDSGTEDFECCFLTEQGHTASVDLFVNGVKQTSFRTNETVFLGEFIPKDGKTYTITFIALADEYYLQSDPLDLGRWCWDSSNEYWCEAPSGGDN